VLSAIVSGFGRFTAAHGFAVNLVAVVVVAGLGAVFAASAVRGDARLARVGVIAGAVFCLADWVLVEDLGFLGGLGTDPNSMIPLILLFTAGWLALTPAPQPAAAAAQAEVPAVQPTAAAAVTEAVAAEAAVTEAAVTEAAVTEAAVTEAAVTEAAVTEAGSAAQSATASAAGAPAGPGEVPGPKTAAQPVPQPAAQAAQSETAPPHTAGPDTAGPGTTPSAQPPTSAPRPIPSWLPDALRPAGLRESLAAVSGWTVAALGAVGVILVGAAPMAMASANHNADPIIAEALAGSSGYMDSPAPNFTLTSQVGRSVSLASLRGKVVLLTFLDPVCVTDCPIIAQEMRAADTLLGSKARGVELVAVVANPTYTSTAFTTAFTRQEGLYQVPNWLYLTGPLSQLQAVWQHYGIEVENLPAGAMSAHNDLAYVIDATGTVREEISDDPGPGTGATQSSFASLLAGAVTQTMGQGQ
jgi:cytochrome oxidase Cu insertion factor (SCO1/SenC/PrrC family)